MSIYQNAKAFVDRGIAIFPVSFRAKTPAVKSWEFYKINLPTAGDLLQWFPCEQRNYAVVLGWQRVACLDFDDMDAFYQWQLWTLDNTKALDTAYMSKTRRGVHVVFSLLENLPNMKLEGIDFKTSGYIVGAGSTHPSGHVYQSLRPLHFPIIERLSDVLPAEMIKHAIDDAQNVQPVNRQQRTPAVSLFDEIENPIIGDNLSPLDIALSRYPIESFFPGAKVNARGFGSVNCLFHSPDNTSAWFSVDKQIFGCSRCNFKPMSPVGLFAALYCHGDIKLAVREMSQ